jgi:hypothetical protein
MARAQAGQPSAARIRKVATAVSNGEAVSGSRERAIIKRKSHGKDRKPSLRNINIAATHRELKAASRPKHAEIMVVIAAAAAAPVNSSSSAAATRTVRSRPSSSVPVQCCAYDGAIIASRS